MAGKRSKYFTCNERLEPCDLSTFDARPFCMSSWQYDRDVARKPKPDELRFFATHHIREGNRAAIGEAGKEGDGSAIR